MNIFIFLFYISYVSVDSLVGHIYVFVYKSKSINTDTFFFFPNEYQLVHVLHGLYLCEDNFGFDYFLRIL